MSYLVLARKYRPQSFADIVGQEHVTRTLENAIAQNRIHHAFLFTGARGVGKTTAARILAKCLSCEKAPTPTPCNECEACKEITQGSSVDVQEIDAASNNGVDSIRELREAIRYAPVRGKKKVYILDEVHMLSGGAWNALLKTLEEPPPHAIFVFATTDPHKLPATILSRVQRYDFKLVPSKILSTHLEGILAHEKITFEPTALQLIIRESGGSVRDSLSLLDQVIAATGDAGLTEKMTAQILGVADRTLLFELGQAILGKDADRALELVDAAYTRGYDLAQLSHAFLGHLRDLLVVASVKTPANLVDASSAELESLKHAATKLPAGLLEMLFDRFARTAEEVSRSPVPRFVLEVGLIELMRVEPLEDLSGLIGKLEALEQRVEKGGGHSSGGSSPSPQQSTVNSQQSTSPAEPSTVDRQPSTSAAPKIPTNFTDLVEALITIEPRLSQLAQSRKIEWTDQKLTLGFDKDFAADGIRERVVQLRTALKTILGKELAVEIIVGALEPARSETLIEVEQRKDDEDREKRRQEAITHPMRKAIDETFGGTWKDPVVDVDSALPITRKE